MKEVVSECKVITINPYTGIKTTVTKRQMRETQEKAMVSYTEKSKWFGLMKDVSRIESTSKSERCWEESDSEDEQLFPPNMFLPYHCGAYAPALPSPYGHGAYAPALPSPYGHGAFAQALPSPYAHGAYAQALPSPYAHGAYAQALPSPYGHGAYAQALPSPYAHCAPVPAILPPVSHPCTPGLIN